MAIAHVQSTVSTNTLAQTFNTVFGVAPTNLNLLVAAIFHDETLQDVSAITSGGWTKQATFDATTLTPDGRQSIFAKIAGVAESQTVAWDIGEVNRRAHGYCIEFSGFIESIADLDAATLSGGENSANGSSIQTGAAINIRTDGLGIAIGGGWGSGLSAFSYDSGLTTQIQSAVNFRGSAAGGSELAQESLGWIEAGGSLQPTLSWTGSRPRSVLFAEIATTLAAETKGSPILIV